MTRDRGPRSSLRPVPRLPILLTSLAVLLSVAGRGWALALGDPPPALALLEQSEGGAAPCEALIFGASWDALTRRVLARQDSLATAGALPEAVRVRAVLEGDQRAVDELRALARFTHVEILADTGGAARRAFLDAVGARRVPYAFLVSRSGGSPRIEWHGRVVHVGEAAPLARFDGVLASVASGTFDIEAERTRRAETARAARTVSELGSASLAAIEADAEAGGEFDAPSPGPMEEGGAWSGALDDVQAAPERLSAEQAIADLRELHAILAGGYAGYDDIAWALECRGSSWEARTTAFESAFTRRSSLEWNECFQFFREYLSQVNDTHFRMSGRARSGAGLMERDEKIVRALVPFVADVRAVAIGGGRYAFAGDPERRPLDLDPLPSPHAVLTMQTYALPTLPEGEFLIGVFAPPATPPTWVTVDALVERDAEEPGTRLRVHRPRLGVSERGAGWSLTLPPDVPLPVLRVGTMMPGRLDGMPESAAQLVAEPAMVLDLRGNGGDADMPGIRWCATLSEQTFVGPGKAQLLAGESNPLRRWESFLPSPVSVSTAAARSGPYRGRVYVLVDRTVQSSGETFAVLASQLENAVLVGESTAGCARYGNVRARGTLTHSRIALEFGGTLFVMDGVRRNKEGVGMFPDVWLDDPDPLAYLAAHERR